MSKSEDLSHSPASVQRAEWIPSAFSGKMRLYSYSDPNAESASSSPHWDLRLIRSRLAHAKSRDHLHLDEAGTIRCPGLELQINAAQARLLASAYESLSPRRLPGMTAPERLLVRTGALLLALYRRLWGQRVLLFFSSPDRDVYGSIYRDRESHFFSIHAKSQQSLERGLADAEHLLAAASE